MTKLQLLLSTVIQILKNLENFYFYPHEVGLKLNIQKTKIMASSPITSGQIDGETVANFIFLGSQITADGVIAAMKLKDAYSLEGKLQLT